MQSRHLLAHKIITSTLSACSYGCSSVSLFCLTLTYPVWWVPTPWSFIIMFHGALTHISRFSLCIISSSLWFAVTAVSLKFSLCLLCSSTPFALLRFHLSKALFGKFRWWEHQVIVWFTLLVSLFSEIVIFRCTFSVSENSCLYQLTNIFPVI